MPAPKDAQQLRSFLGGVNYYGVFVKGMSDFRKPLDALLKDGVKWEWLPVHEKAFKSLKEVLSSDMLLVHTGVRLYGKWVIRHSARSTAPRKTHSFENAREV